MWKLLKFIKKVCKVLFGLLLVLLVVIGVGLYILKQGVPDPWVQRLAEKLSTDEMVVRIEHVSFSLRSGLTIKNIKCFRKRTITETLLSIDKAQAEVVIFSFAPLQQRLKRLTIKAFDFPLLPPRKPRPAGTPREPFPDITLPDVSPFELVLETPNILGIRAEKVTALVSTEQSILTVANIHSVWPDKPDTLAIRGGASLDFRQKRLVGKVAGPAYPGHITPLLSQLRGARNAVKQIDCFQEIARPIQTIYTVDLNLDTLDYAMFLDIDSGKCTYRGVPVQFVKSTLNITDSNNVVKVDIDLKESATHTGTMQGKLLLDINADALYLDATSTVEKDELLTIIHVLYNGELKAITCDSGLHVAAKGVVSINSDNPATTNDLRVAIAFDKGSVLRVPLGKTSTDLHLYAFSAQCDNILATISNGGAATGTFHVAFPNYSASNTTFVTRLTADQADLANLICIADPTNTWPGKLTGTVELSGSLAGDTLPTLQGNGHFKITDGVFARIPLFSGLTSWLANNIPGIGTVVNQSSGELSFVITNGVASTQDLVIEGNIFSIAGAGTYSLPADKLDVSIKVNIFRERSFAGQISRIIAFPFTRMLLDFHLGGSTKEPIWSYVTILEKITDSLSSAPTTEP